MDLDLDSIETLIDIDLTAFAQLLDDDFIQSINDMLDT